MYLLSSLLQHHLIIELNATHVRALCVHNFLTGFFTSGGDFPSGRQKDKHINKSRMLNYVNLAIHVRHCSWQSLVPVCVSGLYRWWTLCFICFFLSFFLVACAKVHHLNMTTELTRKMSKHAFGLCFALFLSCSQPHPVPWLVPGSERGGIKNKVTGWEGGGSGEKPRRERK